MTLRSHQTRRTARLLGAALVAGLVGSTASASVPARMTYAYDLATITGKAATTGASLAFDPRSNEVLVLDAGTVRVFNDAGMEVYAFGTDSELTGIAAITPFGDDGDYLALTYASGGASLVRCDYRGRAVGEVPVEGVPPGLGEFRPHVVGYADGQVYLGDQGRMLVVVVDEGGRYVRHVDLAPMVVASGDPIELAHDKGYADPSVRGLRIDPRGNILFTAPTLFRAFAIAPDGTVRSFGKRGSTPGKFNVVVGLTTDEHGNFYVVDILRASVSVFSADLQFVTQFGGRGRKPGRLIAPNSIVAGNGKVFVSQGIERGVSVFTPVTG